MIPGFFNLSELSVWFQSYLQQFTTLIIIGLRQSFEICMQLHWLGLLDTNTNKQGTHGKSPIFSPLHWAVEVTQTTMICEIRALNNSCYSLFCCFPYLSFQPGHHSSQMCRDPRPPTETPGTRWDRGFGTAGSGLGWDPHTVCFPPEEKLGKTTSDLLLTFTWNKPVTLWCYCDVFILLY